MKGQRRQYVFLGLAAVLIVVGTLGTGFLPSTPFYRRCRLSASGLDLEAVHQNLSGGIIVAGFAVGHTGLRAFEFLE
ncbi:hypothetical protein [Natrinema sp. 1APR25-10V2]|uniref:hypothetical protein n=1 Tax=Natrinema sp. 1APR25-10V2 TaxID=2951081 RepID=UPI002876AF8B|nr:hypothetical protein [Natrinema sp. 1APR25-10V2]MDS0478413.1 hypothetical protein [Natrinema sp. 1APR25-10V2]